MWTCQSGSHFGKIQYGSCLWQMNQNPTFEPLIPEWCVLPLFGRFWLWGIHFRDYFHDKSKMWQSFCQIQYGCLCPMMCNISFKVYLRMGNPLFLGRLPGKLWVHFGPPWIPFHTSKPNSKFGTFFQIRTILQLILLTMSDVIREGNWYDNPLI